MLYPLFVLISLSLIPFLSLGSFGLVALIAVLVIVAGLSAVRRIRLSIGTLVAIVGGLALFDAPYNMQRIVYQLMTIACIGLFFVAFNRLDRRERIQSMVITAVCIVAAIGYYGATSPVGLANAYADWAIISAIPFYFLIRLVDRRAFTAAVSLGFGFLMVLLDNNAALVFPLALLMCWVLPRHVRARRALIVAVAVSAIITATVVKLSVLIPHQGLFMRSVIWNEMLLRLASSPTSLLLGVSRFKEAGYVWLSDSSVLLDPRESGAQYILFGEMAHNYVLSTLIYGGIKGVVVVGAFLFRYLRGAVFARRADLAMFLAVFVYVTFDGFKLLSPDAVSICSAILIYAAVRASECFDAIEIQDTSPAVVPAPGALGAVLGT